LLSQLRLNQDSHPFAADGILDPRIKQRGVMDSTYAPVA